MPRRSLNRTLHLALVLDCHQPQTATNLPRPTAVNRQPSTAANRHRSPITNRQPPPAATPPTANLQSPPTANRQSPPAMVGHMSYTQSFGKTAIQKHFFFPVKDPPGVPPATCERVSETPALPPPPLCAPRWMGLNRGPPPPGTAWVEAPPGAAVPLPYPVLHTWSCGECADLWQASPVSKPANPGLWPGGSAPASCIPSRTGHHCPVTPWHGVGPAVTTTAWRRAPSAPGQDHEMTWCERESVCVFLSVFFFFSKGAYQH